MIKIDNNKLPIYNLGSNFLIAESQKPVNLGKKTFSYYLLLIFLTPFGL